MPPSKAREKRHEILIKGLSASEWRDAEKCPNKDKKPSQCPKQECI